MTMPSGAYSSQQAQPRKEKIPSGYKTYEMQNYTPDQMKLHEQLYGLVDPESQTSRLAAGDEGMFNQMEAPALRQFSQLQGGLASRFSGMGSGATRSSGFKNTMNMAAQDFAGDLQSKRMELRRQAIMDLMGLSESILGQKPYERGLVKKQEKEKSGWGSAIGAGIGAVGGWLGGDPLGGAKLGYDVGSAF